jgi:hypothetical protein
MMKSLTKDIRRRIRQDRCDTIRKTGDAMEEHIAQNRSKEAYGLLKRWYRNVTGKPLTPTREDLAKVSDDFELLFTRRPPPGAELPIHVTPFPIPDNIPDEDEIGGAIMRLKNGKSPGATGMRAEDLKRWYTKREETPEPWDKLVSIIQTTFSTGEIPFVLPNCILALIPKSNSSQVRGIGLMEIIWKTITKIMNDRINENVKFHDGLHGCVPGRGTGTALIETKLAMQLAQRDSRPWYQIFLDLTKAFDSIDRERLLRILAQYGVGPNIIRLLRNFWRKHIYVPRQAGYYGRYFKGERGTTQGDVISGTLFNILIDAITRHWYHEISLIESIGIGQTDTRLMWYVDDNKLHGHDPVVIQQSLDILVDLLARTGMQVNIGKTKAMIVTGGKGIARQSTPAYKRRMTGEGLTYREKKRRRVECPLCGEPLRESNLTDHIRFIHELRRDDENAQINGDEEGEAEAVAVEADDPEEVTYTMSMEDRDSTGECPKCQENIKDRYGMRRHFMHRHLNDKIIIEEEGELPRCPNCGMFGNHGRAHQGTKTCKTGKIRKDLRDMKREQTRARTTRFKIGNEELETVKEFKYLGRITSDDDDDLPAVRDNLKKARARWARVSRVLTRKSATAKMMGKFYLSVVQSVLLYGAETWVLSKRMEGMLEGFHNRCARQMTRQFIHPDPENEGEWITPPVAATLAAAGLLPLMTYVKKRKAVILRFAETRAIYRKCRRSTPMAGNVNQLIWWQLPA